MYNDCISYPGEGETLMNTTTVNVSFQGSLLAEIDRVAQTESRSRSELLREAARLYIDRKRRWDRLFAYGKTLAARGHLREEDVAAEIQSYRKQKAAKR
jgi:metal-responsive CopG/Arc/MetJ family transcriptional regulator